MKKSVIALFIIASCLSANSQFFSKEESAAKEKEKPCLKTTLPEAEQKDVYIEICTAEKKAAQKAAKLFHIKIQHTPEQRDAQQQKANKTKSDLFQHYKEELAKKYQITEEYLAQIDASGKENTWPKATEKPTTE